MPSFWRRKDKYFYLYISLKQKNREKNLQINTVPAVMKIKSYSGFLIIHTKRYTDFINFLLLLLSNQNPHHLKLQVENKTIVKIINKIWQ
jgi:hypothetical protein